MPDSTKHLLLVEDEAALRGRSPSSSPTAAIEVEQAGLGRSGARHASPSSPSTSSSPTCACPASTDPRVIEAAVDRYPDIVAIVVTGYGTVKDAVEAIKRGASDFVSKPFQIDELLHALDSALEQRRLQVGERVPARAARGALSLRRDHRQEPAR